jgi:hypothetical protein
MPRFRTALPCGYGLLITGYRGKANKLLKEGFKVLKKPFSLSEPAAGLGDETESDRVRVM